MTFDRTDESAATATGSAMDFKGHLKATLTLGLPLVFAQIAHMLINVIDTVMLGWLGTRELAAGTLAFQSFFILWILGSGFAFAMVPMIASAMGADDERTVRRHVRMGLWVLSLYFLFVLIPLSFTKEILLFFRQEEPLAILADEYMQIAKWAMLPSLLLLALRSFATALEKTRIIVVVAIITAIVNGVLNYAFIFGNFGAPRMEMRGAALATVITQILSFLIIAAYVRWQADFRRFDIFTRFWRPDWQAFREIITLGWPISLTIIAEVALFSVSSIMMGWFGEVSLASHGIALQIASIAFMVPLGLSQAATVRVGNAIGRKDHAGMMLASKAVLWISTLVVLVLGIIIFAMPETLIGFYLSDDNPDALQVLQYAVPLLYIAAAFQLVDGLQAIASGLLRGMKDTRIPMIIAVISYWGFGMPVAYLLGVHLGWEGPGVWIGLAAGLTMASIMLLYRFYTAAAKLAVDKGDGVI